MKRNICKFLGLFVLLISSFLLISNVSAETKNNAPSSFTLSRKNSTLLDGSKYVKGIVLHFRKKKTDDGKYVYCIEPSDVFTSSSEKYYKSDKTPDAGLTYILEHGYPNKSFTGNSDRDYWITGVAVWMYLTPNDSMWRNFNLSKGTFKGTSSKDVKYIAGLVNGAKKAKFGSYKIKISPTSSDLTLSSDGKYYVSKKMIAKEDKMSEYTVSLSSAPKGTIITDTNGKSKKTFKSGSYFYVKVPAANVTKDVNFKVKVTSTVKVKKAYRYNPKTSSHQSVVALYTETITTSASATLNLKFVKPTKITINKKDSSSKDHVKGAVLVLKDSSGKQIDKWTTDGKSKVFNKLPYGTYYLTEESAPSDYIKSTETKKITISKSNPTVDVTFYNDKSTKVTLIKKDSSNKKHLSGATLVVKNSDDKVVYTWKTDGKEHDITGLPYGTYTVTEEKAPAGFVKSTEISKFTLKCGETEKSITFYNDHETEADIYKIDSASKDQVKGATMVIENASGKEVDRWVTDGKVHISKNLGFGTFTIKEVAAPEGYELNSNPIKFTLTKENYKESINFYNSKKDEKVHTKVNIYKKDSSSKDHVKGATMEVRNSDGEVVDTWVTDGTVHTINDIPFGTYTLREIKAPEGYELNSEEITFTLTKENYEKSVTFYNNKKEEKHTKVNIYKKDSSSKDHVKGAKMEVRNSAGEVVDSWITDGTVHTINDIPFGTYTLREVEAPEGYELNTEPITFTLTEENYEKSVTFYNKKTEEKEEHTKVNIYKKDSSSKDHVKGATMEVRNSDGEVVDTWVTDGTVHTIDDIPFGTYTLREIKAPEGYELSSEVITFTLTKENYEKSVTFYNKKSEEKEEKHAKVNIYKKDSSSKDHVKGAKMEVRNSDGEVVDSWITDGTVHTINDIPFGTYTLHEVEAPEGYELNTEPITFTLTEENYEKSVTFYNKKQGENTVQVKIVKVDSKTGKALAGAVLLVKDSAGNVVARWTTTEEAYLLSNLDPDKTYYIYEESAPSGYVKSDEVVEFTVDEETTTITFENEKEEAPENPKTGIVDYLIPTVATTTSSAMGLKVLKKKKGIKQL